MYSVILKAFPLSFPRLEEEKEKKKKAFEQTQIKMKHRADATPSLFVRLNYRLSFTTHYLREGSPQPPITARARLAAQ